MAYSIVNVSNLPGIKDGSMLKSFKYIKNGNGAEIENGHVVKLDGILAKTDREIFKGVDVAAEDDLADVVLVAGVELDYKAENRTTDAFINKANAPVRGYHFHKGGTFEVSADALDATGEITVGTAIVLAAGTKMAAVASASGATQVGEVIEVYTSAGKQMVTVLCK